MIGLLRSIFASSGKAEPAVPMASSMATEKAWRILAGYDSAKAGGANENHWANADNMASWSANSPEIRERLRNRSRYEVANSSLASGIVSTLTNDTIGTGPMLRVNSGDRKTDRAIETAWCEWCSEIGLVDKLATMRRSRCVDGESFAMMITNPQLPGVALDFRLIEADQVATPDLPINDPRAIDGIRFDAAGNVSEFHVLKQHPGDDRSFGSGLEYDPIPADRMLHISNSQRPGEIRGVPEITPALAMFAVLRRYTIAALLNAENAANIAGVLESESPEDGAAELTPLDAMELEANSFLALPDGWKAKGFRAEQPVNGFREFRREIINEIARCLDMPLNVALASSQDYNFASGRLDHGVYHNSIRIERDHIARTLLNRIFRAFLNEAALLDTSLVPNGLTLGEIKIGWRWPAFPSGDPEKDAKAVKILRNLDLMSDDRYYATYVGSDWEIEADQRVVEREYRAKIGLPEPPKPSETPQPVGVAQGDDDAAEEADE